MTNNERLALLRRIRARRRAEALVREAMQIRPTDPAAARAKVAEAQSRIAAHPGVVVIEINSATHNDTEERRQYACAAMRAQLHNRFDTTDI